MAAYGIVVWLLAGAVGEMWWAQFAMYAASTLLMVVLNNRNSLIRIYSRMVSCSFIVATCAATFLLGSVRSGAVQLLFILFYLSLLRSYQDKRAPGIVFYSFACIGVASLFFVQVLYFVPFLWVLMATNLMAFSTRMFVASLLGIALPYWLFGGYYLYTADMDAIVAHFAQLGEFRMVADWAAVDVHRIVTAAVMAVLSVVGIVHYMRSSYLDKIRTRMIFEMFITVDILAMLFLVLQPQHYDVLLPLVTVNTSCLFAHFIALTRTRLTNAAFLVVCMLMLALTAYNLWF